MEDWLPIVGVAMGAGGAVTALISGWVTSRVERTKNQAAANAAALDGFQELVAALQADNAVLRAELDDCRNTRRRKST